MRTALKLLTVLGQGGAPGLRLTATTTGAQTVTIHRITPTGGSLSINWGDGSALTTVTNGTTTSVAHNYAGAGTWTIVATPRSLITQLDIHDAQLSGFDSRELAANVLTYFYCYSLGSAVASTVRSTDMVGWAPTQWYLYSMPAGGTYAIDSSHMAAWTPTVWWLYSMPAGNYAIDSSHMTTWTPTQWYFYSMPTGTYAIDSADMAGWTPTHWRLYSMPTGTYAIDSSHMTAWRPLFWQLFSMPAGTYAIDTTDMTAWTPTYWYLYSMPTGTYTFAASCMRNWVGARNILVNDLGLAAGVVDAILTDIYAGKATFTYATPALNVGGTNADPTGTYQAACPPTSGKETAYELVNDSCAVGGPEWTVTY